MIVCTVCQCSCSDIAYGLKNTTLYICACVHVATYERACTTLKWVTKKLTVRIFFRGIIRKRNTLPVMVVYFYRLHPNFTMLCFLSDIEIIMHGKANVVPTCTWIILEHYICRQPICYNQEMEFVGTCIWRLTHTYMYMYVALAGPVERTMPGVWRMIWEYNVPSIVMVTNFTEMSTMKVWTICH